MNYIDLIQLGFHGLAFALFYLSYRRFGDISSDRIPENVPQQEINERNKRTKMLLGSLKWFMVVSLAFLLIGIGAQIYSKQVKQEISLIISPNTFPSYLKQPVIYKTGTTINGHLKQDDGRYVLSVVDQDDIKVEIDSLLSYIERMEEIANNQLSTSQSTSTGF